MSVAERQNPDANIDVVLDECQRIKWPIGATHAELAAEFAHQVERCAACGYQSGSSELAARFALVAQLYGAELAAKVAR